MTDSSIKIESMEQLCTEIDFKCDACEYIGKWNSFDFRSVSNGECVIFACPACGYEADGLRIYIKEDK